MAHSVLGIKRALNSKWALLPTMANDTFIASVADFKIELSTPSLIIVTMYKIFLGVDIDCHISIIPSDIL